LATWSNEVNSYGETDESGHFSLTCNYGNQPGAVVGKHVVRVGEKSFPEARRQDAAAAKRVADKIAKRPGPSQPTKFPGGKDGLEVEIKKGQSTYDLNLTR